ncbi:MAG: Coenzyme PQQ synthesis protein B [Enhydrobacter sp.]|jgi:pyrroloquinoline quinone biosynthesis protein B|nr:MAG: Coenzyme PQQ synthesis protein B [Enhydrobacter sp.]
MATAMRAVVLGAAAGGGFPQWNSNTEACRRARAGDGKAMPRTQASLAVSGDGERWFLVNASPDLRQQIEARPFLHPRRGLRSSPIEGVVLTGADVDAIAGLLHLRERQAFTIYATARVIDVLKANPIFGVLAEECVRREAVPLEKTFELRHIDGSDSGIAAELFDVPGKVALYLEPGDAPEALAGRPGDTVGVELRAGSDRLIYVPGCARMTDGLRQRLAGASVVLFDGTLWHDDEMIRLGLGPKTGQRMGHMSVSGADGTIAAFRGLPVRRRILVHINNSNPILLDDSPERAVLEKEGWEVAYDGMEVSP